MKNKPIGIFDSGLGGLTVTKEIIKLLPNEDIVYLGDTARVPYGTRSAEVVRDFSLDDAKFLLTKDVKVVVIACNTASALAGDWIKEKIKIPVFEVIAPAAKLAAETTVNNKIGVIGTRGTIGSNVYQRLIKKNNKNAEITATACPLFVPFIEEGVVESEALKIIASNYLKDIINKDVDTLVMGCTHYPIIENVLRSIMDENVNIINPGVCQAKEVYSFLKNNDLFKDEKGEVVRSYYVTDFTERFVKVAEMFLGGKIHGSLQKAVL